MYESRPPWDNQTLQHRPIDMIRDFEEYDLEEYANSAERAADHAADHPTRDLMELYISADTVRAAVRHRRWRRQ